MAVVHFISLIAERVSPITKKKDLHTTRQDWYCFFSPKVLLGEDNTEEPIIREIQLDSARQIERRRQQEKRRFVLKA